MSVLENRSRLTCLDLGHLKMDPGGASHSSTIITTETDWPTPCKHILKTYEVKEVPNLRYKIDAVCTFQLHDKYTTIDDFQ